MKSTKFIVVVLLAAAAPVGCGPRRSVLDQLAAAGVINERAPVTAHVEIQIAAPPPVVWALLINAQAWPKWQKDIESVAVSGPLSAGTRFSWKASATDIQSQVQLFEPERRLSWTGTAMTAKAIHVWELRSVGNQTRVLMKESMDGPMMAKFYPSSKLSEAGMNWLIALKRAAESANQVQTQ
jgi:uncharacterized protein YndB with AHSA1/START domain